MACCVRSVHIAINLLIILALPICIPEKRNAAMILESNLNRNQLASNINN